MHFSFFFEQGLAANLLINVVGHAVELEIKRLQSGFGGFLRELKVAHQNAVGRRLNMREAHLLSQAQHVEEPGIGRRLAARELNHAAGYRTLVAERLEHFADLGETRLIERAGGVGIGEADRAGQVAAVRQIDVGQRRVGLMHRAQAALVGTVLRVGDCWIRQSAVVAEVPLLHLEIELHVGINEVAEVAVLGAVLFHEDLAVFLEQTRVDYLGAVGAERLSLLGQALLHGRDLPPSVSRLRLEEFEIRPHVVGKVRLGINAFEVGAGGRRGLFRRKCLSAHELLSSLLGNACPGNDCVGYTGIHSLALKVRC